MLLRPPLWFPPLVARASVFATDLCPETLEVALDVSGDGKLPLPPYPANSPSEIYNITIFLSSYTTGKNFTITNGTASANNASLGDIMRSEPGSTVKHVRWTWPDCLAGNNDSSPRGAYNISIRQNFRLNGTDHYTIFDVPVSVTNAIAQDPSRPSCGELENPLLTPQEVDVAGADAGVPVLFAPGDSTVVQTAAGSSPTGQGGKSAAAGGGVVVYWVCLVGGIVAIVI